MKLLQHATSNAPMVVELGALEYVLITVIKRNPGIHGFDVVKLLTGQACGRNHQQIYRELGKLSKGGHVSVEVQPLEGKPDRKCYSLINPKQLYMTSPSTIKLEYLQYLQDAGLVLDCFINTLGKVRSLNKSIENDSIVTDSYIQNKLDLDLDYLEKLYISMCDDKCEAKRAIAYSLAK